LNAYNSTLDLEAAAGMIRSCPGPIVVVAHAKPDGDAFGSVVALTAALKLLDKPVHGYLVGPVPANFSQLDGYELVTVCSRDPEVIAAWTQGELYVVLDTGAWSQLGPQRAVIEPNLHKTLIIDHHLSGDVSAAHRHIDGNAAACCEIMAGLVDHLLGNSPDDSSLLLTLREALFVGIASDTGWFHFANTRPQTHELAAHLQRCGVDHAELYRRLEQMERPEKLQLLIRAVDSLQLLADGKAAMMVLRSKDFAETGALEEETDRLIDIPQQISTIEVIVLVTERIIKSDDGPRNITRLSFRSKPGPKAINVAELAGRFGGGGHARAAGARVEQAVDDVLPRVAEALDHVANVSSA
jgi:phosphoesterase RecJ-like protein